MLSRDQRTCADFNDTTKSAPEVRESLARDIRREPTDPDHTRWHVRTSPFGHRPLELLDDSARCRGVERFSELQRGPHGSRGQAVRSILGAFNA